MDNVLEIDLILNQKRYSKIYNTSLIIMAIILIVIYVAFTYKYQTYYVIKGKMQDNKLELLVNISDIKYIKNNAVMKIDNELHSYRVTTISKEIYVDEKYNNYKYIYLDVNNLNNIDNYVYEVNGGASWGIVAAIAAGLVFIIGGLSGYTNPSRCNNR